MKNRKTNIFSFIVIKRNSFTVLIDLYLTAVLNGFLYEFVVYLILKNKFRKTVFPNFQYSSFGGPLYMKKKQIKSIIKRLRKVGLVKIYGGALIIPEQIELLKEFQLKYSTKKMNVNVRENMFENFNKAIDITWKALTSTAKKTDIYLDFRDGNPYETYVLEGFLI